MDEKIDFEALVNVLIAEIDRQLPYGIKEIKKATPSLDELIRMMPRGAFIALCAGILLLDVYNDQPVQKEQ